MFRISNEYFVNIYLAIQTSAVIAHFASYTPLFGHRFVELFARFVKYFRPLGCFPVPTSGTATAIVTPITVLGIFRALFVTGNLLLLISLLSQRDS